MILVNATAKLFVIVVEFTHINKSQITIETFMFQMLTITQQKKRPSYMPSR